MQATISSSLPKVHPTASNVQSWSPSLGRIYQTPASGPSSSTTTTAKQLRGATPLPDSRTTSTTAPGTDLPSDWLFEEALVVNEQYGDQRMDENPITGKPGDFHLSSTGRKGPVNLSAAANLKKAALVLDTKLGAGSNESPLAAGKKETKSPKTPGGGGGFGGGAQKGKKRKSSKAAVTPS